MEEEEAHSANKCNINIIIIASQNNFHTCDLSAAGVLDFLIPRGLIWSCIIIIIIIFLIFLKSKYLDIFKILNGNINI